MIKKWPKVAVKFYEQYKVDESFQSIIHKILEIYEQYQKDLENIETQLQENVLASQNEPLLQQSATQNDKSLQIETALILEESLQTQQPSDSMDPLMSPTQIKCELSQRKSSFSEKSVYIIDKSPEKPIIIEDSILIQASSQPGTDDESILGKAERKACQDLHELRFE